MSAPAHYRPRSGDIIPPDRITIREACLRLSCCKRHVMALVADGSLVCLQRPRQPGSPRGGDRYITVASLRAYLEGRTIIAPPERLPRLGE